MTQRPKRRAGFNAANDPKMTAEEYERLIGRHKHIEHKALRQEVAKEFAQFTKRNKSTKVIESNNFLNPPQPPPLPMEANQFQQQQFRRAVPWPSYSIIQRMAHMLFYGTYGEQRVIKYLQTIKIPQVQIDIALEIYDLMIQSTKYWRKHHQIKNYNQRYNALTRKYALQKAPWSLHIAMTLIDFHIDHIVDIVYKKEVWSKDFDEYFQRKQELKKPHNNNNNNNDNDNNYDSTGTTSEYEEEYETESEYEEEIDSEEEMIGKVISRQKQKEKEMITEQQQQQQKQQEYVNQVADHMTVEQLNDIKKKAHQQSNMSVDDLFQSIFAAMPDGKKIAFADNFEIDLNDDDDDDDGNNDSFDVANNDQLHNEEKSQFEQDNDTTMKLNKLYQKYPELDKNLIYQTFIQQQKNYDLTVFQLDAIDSQTIETNAFYQQQNKK